MTFINPGSRVPPGVPNLYEVAEARAKKWLAQIRSDGWPEVELVLPGVPGRDSRWSFEFRHSVTGAVARLDQHGITSEAADEAGMIFGPPRVYWNGCSSSTPAPSDWVAADGEWTWKFQYVPRGEAAVPPDPQ